MWKPRRHENQVTSFQVMWLALESELAFTGKDLNQSFLRGGVLRQFLALRKPEEDNPGRWGAEQSAADNPVRRILGFGRQ